MPKNNFVSPSIEILGLDDAHGPIPIRMTNDYLFRVLMQCNKNEGNWPERSLCYL